MLELLAEIMDTICHLSIVKLGALGRQILDEFIYIMRPFEQATDINQEDITLLQVASTNNYWITFSLR